MVGQGRREDRDSGGAVPARLPPSFTPPSLTTRARCSLRRIVRQDQAKIFSFSLDDDDRGRIQAVLDKGKRPKGDCYEWERGGAW